MDHVEFDSTMTVLVDPATLTLNPDNPRTMTEAQFEKLKQSIREFPQMLELRPIIIDENNVIIGGNQRIRACLDLGIKSVPCIRAKDLTEAQLEEFLIKDNTTYGEWDWDKLANEWDAADLVDWGVDAPKEYADAFAPTLDPQFSDKQITQEEIEKRAQKLAGEMVKEMKSRDMICPECGHEFKVTA